MAKGFTVKSAAAKAKKEAKAPEWDYDKARRMIAGKTVVFCLPCLLYTSDAADDL